MDNMFSLADYNNLCIIKSMTVAFLLHYTLLHSKIGTAFYYIAPKFPKNHLSEYSK